MCGGSCAPAELWWSRNGVVYVIQVRLPSDTAEPRQKKVLLETANAMVRVRAPDTNRRSAKPRAGDA